MGYLPGCSFALWSCLMIVIVWWCFKDASIEPEEFTTRLQAQLNSSPQPYLVPFLRVSKVFVVQVSLGDIVTRVDPNKNNCPDFRGRTAPPTLIIWGVGAPDPPLVVTPVVNSLSTGLVVRDVSFQTRCNWLLFYIIFDSNFRYVHVKRVL